MKTKRPRPARYPARPADGPQHLAQYVFLLCTVLGDTGPPKEAKVSRRKKNKKTLSSFSESRPVRDFHRPDPLHSLTNLVGLLADSPTRDAKVITNRRLRSGFSHLNSIQDGRREQDISKTHGSRRYLTTASTPAEVVRRDVSSSRMQRAGMPAQVRAEFRDPQRTIVCVRRRARKAALFALRKIGKGAGKKRLKRARWSDSSYITCKKR